MGRRKISYNDVLEANYERISKFYETEYYEYLRDSEPDFIKKVVTEALYVDPDRKKKVTVQVKGKDIILSADGIVSVKNLYDLFDGKNGREWIEEYKIIRSEVRVCLFWPSHHGGINSCRARVFDDRVDYTLFDIKRFYEILDEYKEYGEQRIKTEVEKQCKLGTAFIKAETFTWLCTFENFVDFIKNRNLENFVDLEFEVIDLEVNRPITGYKKGKYEYSKAYYKNLRQLLIN